MRTRLSAFVLAAVVAGLLASFACTKEVEVTRTIEKTVVVVQTATAGPATATPRPAPTATAKPKPAVNFEIGLPADVTTTNIWNILGPGATAYNSYVFVNHYPILYALSDRRFDFVPLAAAELPPDPVQEGDKWTVTIGLKSGMKWTDGSEITADDFAFTVNSSLALKLTGNWSINIPPDVVLGAEAVDPHTVKISFSAKPGLAQWQYGVARTNFVQKKFWESAVNTAMNLPTYDEKRNSIYTSDSTGEPTAGEAVFDKWESGAFVQQSANPDYYWAGSSFKEYSGGGYEETTANGTFETGVTSGSVDLEATRGPYFQTVTFNVYGSQDAAILALRGGDIDYFLSPNGLSQGLKSQVQGQPGVGTFQNPSDGFRYLGFNLRRAPMDDKAFRQAVAILIDKEFLTRSVLQGAAEPVDTIVPKGNSAWFNPSVPMYGRNDDGSNMSREERINGVVKLLKENGYTWDVEPAWNADNRQVDAGSGLKKNGTPVNALEILAPSAGYDPLRATSAIWIEQWLKEAGIPVKANLTGFNPIVDRVFTQQDFDMWILGWNLTPYPSYLADFFTSDHTGKDDVNAGGYSNPQFDAKAKAFKAETDLEKARQDAFDLQAFLADDLPYVTLFSPPILEVYRTDRVKFAYTDALDGVQNTFQYINQPLALTQFE